MKARLDKKLFISIASEIPWWDDKKQRQIFRYLSDLWQSSGETDMEAFILEYVDQEELL